MHFRFFSSLPTILVILLFGTQSFFPLQIYAYTDHDCYPPWTPVEEQYIIRYGLLMQKESKDGTNPNNGESTPIRVDGYERSWTRKVESASFSTTYLGAHENPNVTSSFNAVYFRVPRTAGLQSYDKREGLYCREEVDKSQVHLIKKDSIKKGLPKGQFWIYVSRPENRETPTDDYPIVQSYVDRFISGCLELEMDHKLEGFAEECVTTTSSWEYPWVNDRIYPRRAFLYQKNAIEIDSILNKTVYEAYIKIRIGG